MLLRPFLNDQGSCASYLFGCTTHRKLAVVESVRDVLLTDRGMAVALIDDLAGDTAVRFGDETEGDGLARPVPDGVGHQLAYDELDTIDRVGIGVIIERVPHVPSGFSDRGGMRRQ